MGKSKAYRDIEGDEIVKLNAGSNVLKISCCDCGLVHLFVLTKNNRALQIFRENGSTGQLRRYRDFVCKPVKNDD